jgi:transcriptional regulator with XRE-family HTH domain
MAGDMEITSSETRQNIGENVRALRIEMRLSVEQLANAVEVGRQYVYEIEAGKANFTIKRLESIAEALNVPVARLLMKPVGVR